MDKGPNRWIILLSLTLVGVVSYFVINASRVDRGQKPNSVYDEELREQEVTLKMGQPAPRSSLQQGFAFSASVCGVKLDDTFAQVIKAFGKNYRESTTCYGDHAVICYQDPKANLEIDFFGKNKELTPQNVVNEISLYESAGKKDARYLSKASFASLGDIRGIRPGSTLAEIEKIYGKIPIDKRALELRIKIQCSENPKTWLIYDLYEKKVTSVAACRE